MKKLLPLFLFFVSFLAASQDIKRETINGKIIVEGNDIEGISIYNASSSIATITNINGEFTIAVALNDIIEFRALEYQNFEVKINKTILESKTMTVFLIEEINELDEIVVTNKTKALSGDIKTDIKTFSPKLDVIYFGIKNEDLYNLDNTGNTSEIKNLGMHSQARTTINGLNVVNVVDQLLIPLFRSEVKDKKAARVPEVPVKSIKYYLGSTFLVENFNIPEHRVEEFIRYVEAEAFDFNLLNYGHEMEFLELLTKKSTLFLNTKNKTD